MIQFIALLSYFQTTKIVQSEKCLALFYDMEYGFKKNAQVFLNFSNISLDFIFFGFATKKETYFIKALNSISPYCNGSEKLSEFQFFVENGISLNFTIPSKSILTPFCIACSEMYEFQIENIKINHNLI